MKGRDLGKGKTYSGKNGKDWVKGYAGVSQGKPEVKLLSKVNSL